MSNNNNSWKEITDSKSGRVYYYNKVTKETTWEKPIELATPKEREKMLQKRQEQLEFFAEMEANIKRKLKEAALITVSSIDSIVNHYGDFDKNEHLQSDPQFASINWGQYLDSKPEDIHINGPAMIRTTRSISSMDDDIIRTMRRTDSNAGLNAEYYLRSDSTDQASRSSGNDFRSIQVTRTRTFSTNSNGSGENCTLADAKASLEMKRVDNLLSKQTKHCIGNRESSSSSIEKYFTMSDAIAEPKNSNPIQPFKRRNSTGTIFVETTMSNQDDDATITAVCIIIRTHMIIAAKEKSQSARQYDVFKDTNLNSDASSPKRRPSIEQYMRESVPSLNTVREYFKNIFSRSQLESECIIMTLIYIERLIKCTTGRLYIRHDNWKSIVFSTLMMSSKVWDDLSMWNVDFSQATRGFTLSHVNELEIAFLEAVGYSIRVSAGEYAKYYFHLRSMMVKLGFTDYKKNLVAPLNIEGARKLQLASEKCEFNRTSSVRTSSVRRTRSVVNIASLDVTKLNLKDSKSYSDDNKNLYKCLVALEQLINENHTDADGSKKTSSSSSSFSQRLNSNNKSVQSSKVVDIERFFIQSSVHLPITDTDTEQEDIDIDISEENSELQRLLIQTAEPLPYLKRDDYDNIIGIQWQNDFMDSWT